MLELKQTPKNKFCCNINSDALLGNLAILSHKSRILKFSGKFLRYYWKQFESDIIRLGYNTVLCDDIDGLVNVTDSIKRILLPYSIGNNDVDCSKNGILPVIDDLNQCYALTNIAQMFGFHLEFILHIKSSSVYPGIQDEQAENILLKLLEIPMISLTSLLLDFMPSFSDMQYLRKMLFESENSADLDMYVPLNIKSGDYEQVKGYITDEAIGLNLNNGFVFPLVIYIWGYPIEEDKDFVKYRCYAGRIDSLPESFPVSVPDFDAEVANVEMDYFDIIVKGRPCSFIPIKVYLTGGDELNSVDLTKWDKKSLKTFIFANQFI